MPPMQAAFLAPTQLTPRPTHAPRQAGCAACRPRRAVSCSQHDISGNAHKRRRRPMSAEARAKISAALKGRRKSEEHRENLRRRFGGDQNPMYGRKLSPETRAKISRAMIARNQKKDEQPRHLQDDRVLDALRVKAQASRLVESALHPPKRPGRRLIDEREAKEVDRILERVARLDQPPESVVKAIRNMEKKREGAVRQRVGENAPNEHQERQMAQCHACDGSGMTRCPECVGAFGVTSARCETCFGAGAVFCAACEGAGSLAKQ